MNLSGTVLKGRYCILELLEKAVEGKFTLPEIWNWAFCGR